MERLAADALVPDLVVADYHLDRGACGTDVITTLRRRYGNNLPALVVSGDRSMQLRASLKASGHAFLAKPVSPARLRAMINYLVNPPTDE
ncbi:MAG: response regulator [Rhodopila sp.]